MSQERASDAPWFAERFTSICSNIEQVIHGKGAVVRLAITCLVAEGHLLIEDVPGTGKTYLARALSSSVDASWHRIQFTPDLLPSDVTGVSIYHQGNQSFEFHEGPVFANIVLADEINRASPKTQSALLEVMEEQRVTVDGRPYPVPRPFMVIATQNPIEMEGTYELPEAQRDRFLMRAQMGYPDPAAEADILTDKSSNVVVERLKPVVGIDDLKRMVAEAARVDVSRAVVDYIVAVVSATRTLSDLRLGASPRATVALQRACRALALASGRTYVVPEDVKELAAPVLAHRLILTPEASVQGRTTTGLVQSILQAVPVPKSTSG